jgi:hypothetical protein
MILDFFLNLFLVISLGMGFVFGSGMILLHKDFKAAFLCFAPAVFFLLLTILY